MDSCEIENAAEENSFQEVYDAMQEDPYWIRFFCRPCCPAPNQEEAIIKLNMLQLQVDRDDSFTDDEKEQLKAVIESRKEWYPTSGICHR